MADTWEPMQVKLGRIVPIITEALIRGSKILLVGSPGIGKTAVLNSIIANLPPYVLDGMGALLINWFLAQEQEEDVGGVPGKVSDSNGDYATHLLFEKQRQNMTITDRYVVNFLDDVLHGSTRKQAANLQFIRGFILGHTVPDNVRFIAATNDVKHMAGTVKAIEPFKSSFTCIFHAIADHPFWEKWAISSGLVRPDVIAYLNTNPHALDMFNPSVSLTQCPSPRTWVHLSDMLNICEAVGTDEYHMKASAEGAIGAPETVAFFAFKSMVDNAVTPQIILADPHGANVPENASVMYAVSLALCNVVETQETAEYAMQYARRLPAEFEALIVRQLVNHDETYKFTNEYIEYTARQSDMML